MVDPGHRGALGVGDRLVPQLIKIYKYIWVVFFCLVQLSYYLHWSPVANYNPRFFCPLCTLTKKHWFAMTHRFPLLPIFENDAECLLLLHDNLMTIHISKYIYIFIHQPWALGDIYILYDNNVQYKTHCFNFKWSYTCIMNIHAKPHEITVVWNRNWVIEHTS